MQLNNTKGKSYYHNEDFDFEEDKPKKHERSHYRTLCDRKNEVEMGRKRLRLYQYS